jgi:aspartyl-tRNA(Asn)/glutamyl-tRNA(Gln) amidotransferase subunit A
LKNLVSIIADLKSGAVSSESLVNQSLQACTKAQPLNAFVSLRAEEALAEARKADALRAQGQNQSLLQGIPLGVKDNMCLENNRTTAGSKILSKFISPYTATALSKLIDAGGIVLGKTNLDEFAMGSTTESSFFGPTLNPVDSGLIPGGSSGGSAAAVAAGLVPAALGSDTGGSIRQPAACCGVVGLKPTYGRVSRYGLIAYASSLDQIGPITQNVEDAALLLNIISGQDDRDCSSSHHPLEDFTTDLKKEIKRKKIGVPVEYFGDGLDAECKSALMANLYQLEKEGAELVEVHLPSLEFAIASYYILATAEASSNLSRFDGVRYTHRSPEARTLEQMFSKSRSEGFGKEVKKRILLGTFVLSSGFYDAYYVQAQKIRQLIKNDFLKAFEKCDVLAAPVLPGLPLKTGAGLEDPMAMYLSDIYTVSLNLTGFPGISVPCAKVKNHSISLQFFGKAFAETELLNMAYALEHTALR